MELGAAPLDLDVLAALVAIALVAAVGAELAPLDLDVLLVAVPWWWRCWSTIAAVAPARRLDPAPWRWSPIAAVTIRGRGWR